MYTLVKSKVAFVSAGAHRVPASRRRTSVIVCRNGGVDEARLEKLKEVAKRVVADKRKGCSKAVAAVKELVDSEREIYKTLIDELKALAQEDINRMRNHIAANGMDTQKDVVDAVDEPSEDGESKK